MPIPPTLLNKAKVPQLLLGLALSILPIAWAAGAEVVESDLFIEEKTIEIGGQTDKKWQDCGIDI